jgi:hypothetical protein
MDKHFSFLRKSVNYGQKSFITLALSVNVFNFFSTSLAFEQNKLECLTFTKLFILSNPIGASYSNIQFFEIRLKDVNIHYSLAYSAGSSSDEEKKFNNLVNRTLASTTKAASPVLVR